MLVLGLGLRYLNAFRISGGYGIGIPLGLVVVFLTIALPYQLAVVIRCAR